MTKKTEMIQIRITKEFKDMFKEAADQMALSVNAWATMHLVGAAKRQKKEESD